MINNLPDKFGFLALCVFDSVNINIVSEAKKCASHFCREKKFNQFSEIKHMDILLLLHQKKLSRVQLSIVHVTLAMDGGDGGSLNNYVYYLISQ